jgi:hypothetical protein
MLCQNLQIYFRSEIEVCVSNSCCFILFGLGCSVEGDNKCDIVRNAHSITVYYTDVNCGCYKGVVI